MSATLAGFPIWSLHLVHPGRGACSADVGVDTLTPLSGQVTLELPGLSLLCTVVSGGVKYARQQVRLVGGRGGLSKILKGQHFYQTNLRTAIQHTLGAAGEQLDPGSDPAALAAPITSWHRQPGPAAAALNTLCAAAGTDWQVQSDGSVRIGLPAWAESTPDAELVQQGLVERQLLVAPIGSPPLPGTTYQGQRIVSVEHRMSGASWRAVARY